MLNMYTYREFQLYVAEFIAMTRWNTVTCVLMLSIGHSTSNDSYQTMSEYKMAFTMLRYYVTIYRDRVGQSFLLWHSLLDEHYDSRFIYKLLAWKIFFLRTWYIRDPVYYSLTSWWVSSVLQQYFIIICF